MMMYNCFLFSIGGGLHGRPTTPFFTYSTPSSVDNSEAISIGLISLIYRKMFIFPL
jgi:hypothetical protein